MAEFNEAIDVILAHEGSAFTMLPGDPGGATKFGITLRTLAAYEGKDETPDNVKQLTETEARTIYRLKYWDERLDSITDQTVATKIFDMAVNVGPVESILLLQQALADCGKTVLVDGRFGPGTLGAVNQCAAEDILRAICDRQMGHYVSWVNNNPVERSKFLLGLKNRAMWGYPPPVPALFGGEQP